MTPRVRVYMLQSSAVVVLTRVYVANPRHTRQLLAVALSPEEVTSIWCCSVHAAAVASCERRAGLTPTACSFKKQSDTYRRSSHDSPCSLFCWPSRRRKTYFYQVKAMRRETDSKLKSATSYRRSCSDTKKSPPPWA